MSPPQAAPEGNGPEQLEGPTRAAQRPNVRQAGLAQTQLELAWLCCQEAQAAARVALMLTLISPVPTGEGGSAHLGWIQCWEEAQPRVRLQCPRETVSHPGPSPGCSHGGPGNVGRQ